MWMKNSEQATPRWAHCSLESRWGQHHSPLIAGKHSKCSVLSSPREGVRNQTGHLLFPLASWPFSSTLSFSPQINQVGKQWESFKKPLCLCSHSWSVPELLRQACLSSRKAKEWEFQFWKSKQKFSCHGKFVRMTVTRPKTWANHKTL